MTYECCGPWKDCIRKAESARSNMWIYPSEGVADESKTARPQTLLLLIFCIYKFGKWQKNCNKTLAD